MEPHPPCRRLLIDALVRPMAPEALAVDPGWATARETARRVLARLAVA